MFLRGCRMSVPPWEVNVLTIVAVLKGADGALYIGADSQWTDSEGLKNFKTKLTVVNGRDNILVWATAGNPQIGVTEFGKWVGERPRQENETWQVFVEAASQEFARLNGIRKKNGKIAGEDVESPSFKARNLCQMLLCGRLNGQVDAYYLNPDGGFQNFLTAGDFLTIGSGATYVEAVYGTLISLRGEFSQTDDHVFSRILELTARHGRDCNLPYEYIKLTQDEVFRYRSKEPEPGVDAVFTEDKDAKPFVG